MKQSHLFYQTNQPRPLLDRAEGIYMWDINGKRYIDGSSGAMVSNIGHSNPNVLAAIRRQMEKSSFGYRLHFENEPAELLAAKVSQLSPDGHDKVFFTSGGSEAVESAVKLARQYVYSRGDLKRWKVISRSPSYHGATLGALSLTSYDPLTEPFEPLLIPMPKIPAPQCYLDRDDLTQAQRGIRYADMLREKILQEGPETVLAFIMEPVGGASTGALVAPGRTGKFLAAEHWHINPDIIATAKGFGAGYIPLGAITTSARIVDVVLDADEFQHGFTYAGNPTACAAGLAVIEEIYRQDMMSNTLRVGEKLMAGLRELMQRYPFIGDVRGKGLLTAFELVSDRSSMAPLPAGLDADEHLVELAYNRGLIIYSRRTRGGHEGDHFLVCPPMITTQEQLAEILEILDDSLLALAKQLNLPVGIQ